LQSGGADSGLVAAGIEHSVTVQCTIRLWRSWDVLSLRAFVLFPVLPFLSARAISPRKSFVPWPDSPNSGQVKRKRNPVARLRASEIRAALRTQCSGSKAWRPFRTRRNRLCAATSVTQERRTTRTVPLLFLASRVPRS